MADEVVLGTSLEYEEARRDAERFWNWVQRAGQAQQVLAAARDAASALEVLRGQAEGLAKAIAAAEERKAELDTHLAGLAERVRVEALAGRAIIAAEIGKAREEADQQTAIITAEIADARQAAEARLLDIGQAVDRAQAQAAQVVADCDTAIAAAQQAMATKQAELEALTATLRQMQARLSGVLPEGGA